MRKYFMFGFLILLLGSLIGCTNSHADHPKKFEQKENNKLVIYTSMYPLAFFAKEIGGTEVTVHNLTPPGAEPHDYEPTQKDLIELNRADMLIYNGAGLEGWIDRVRSNLDSQQILIVESTKNIALHDSTEQEEDHAHDSQTINKDPHVWLDPILAKKQAENIKQAMIQKDPKHKTLYEQNYQKLAKRFNQLDQSYRSVLSQVKNKNVITSHAAFHYLTERYGLKQIAISGISPDEEPSPKKLKEIVQFAEQEKIHYIFFEKLVNPKVAQVVTDEIHAKALILDPIEGLTTDELKKGEDYFSISMQNLENLKKALE
ncbi:zinc ABC transporter substrate-binding protein [Shimazuella sp. AN120528]|uniref:metal ABC transporter solute-binding protein, Zn/Mn family n=1 Tax=Shimazuella soli TaxID=1892854 RepID=UPI001F10262E|nr:zinc ABC transporter substrate-binding protein [Shimazuella soli]MCH5584804.1 zinc ABC transporter substrate-binding protein [Shimazuella soli]